MLIYKAFWNAEFTISEMEKELNELLEKIDKLKSWKT